MAGIYIPDVFDFYSTVNGLTRGRVYHAERQGGRYEIVLEQDQNLWVQTVDRVKKNIEDGTYAIIEGTERNYGKAH